jgi:hypothetical protein
MQKRQVLGLFESVILHGKNKSKTILARIDTGAVKSSIDTNLAKELGLGPFEKFKTIKSASGTQERPIIQTKVTILNQEFEEEFNIADRSKLTFTALIGQNILKKGKFLIDPLKEVNKE